MSTLTRISTVLGGLTAAAVLATATPALADTTDAYPMDIIIGCGSINVRASYSTSSAIRGVAYRGDRLRETKVRVSSKTHLITWRYGKVTRRDGKVIYGWLSQKACRYPFL